MKGKSGQRKGLPLTASEPNNDKSSTKKAEKIEKNNTPSSDSDQPTHGTKTNVSAHKSHSKNNRSHSPPAISKVKYKEEKADESQTSKKCNDRKSTDDASSSINYLDSNSKQNKSRREKPLRIQSSPQIGEISKSQIQYSRLRNFSYDFSDSESSVAEVIPPSPKNARIRENSSSELIKLSKKNQKFDISDSEPLNAMRDSLCSPDTKSKASDLDTPSPKPEESKNQISLAAASREKYQNQDSKKTKFANKPTQSLNSKVDMSDSDTSVAVFIPPSKMQRPNTVYLDKTPSSIKISKNEDSDLDTSVAEQNPPSITQRSRSLIGEKPTNADLNKSDLSDLDTSVAEQIPASKMQRPKTTVFSQPPILSKYGKYNDSDSDTSVAEQIPPSKMQRPKTTTFEKAPVSISNKKVIISDSDTSFTEKKPQTAQSRAPTKSNIVDSSDSDSVAIQIPASKMKRPKTTTFEKAPVSISNKKVIISDSDTSFTEKKPQTAQSRAPAKSNIVDSSDSDSVAIQIPASKMKRPQTTYYAKSPININNKNSFTSDSDTSVAEQIPPSQIQKTNNKKETSEYSDTSVAVQIPSSKMSRPKTLVIPHPPVKLKKEKNGNSESDSEDRNPPKKTKPAPNVANRKQIMSVQFPQNHSFNWSDSDSSVAEVIPPDELRAEKIAYLKAHPEANFEISPSSQISEWSSYDKLKSLDTSEHDSSKKETLHQKFQKVDLDVKKSSKKIEKSESEPSLPAQSSIRPSKSEVSDSSSVAIRILPSPTEFESKPDTEPSKLSNGALPDETKNSSNSYVSDNDHSYNSASSLIENKVTKKKSQKRKESSSNNSSDGKDKKKAKEEPKSTEQKESSSPNSKGNPKDSPKNKEKAKKEESDSEYYSYSYNYYSYYSSSDTSTTKEEKSKKSSKKK
ncbi:hypothetical protein TVAG_321360 [Trichomonas vaginalis G3]|uniref:Uncharacterized protein n=1 Tax=Trichomonas vaginalis (strain ATCC PRA-98 / G3) TaxID=412133 RepID=A2FK59_TRIV3|nr:hypothetical protein TVAGG3_0625070 [Trichomonas vaginalis G3]EAX94699.1 hypothetical protein TVAG_321360 [Trichomonas vaginalis G3]KAI5504129.1 hypothetical protein TVAGG3_0625070 [Trichomonas vaginalis G3]|eukprot:XP_001307629.1 hypothetical protein [Trichomonas vaginalis G3]